MKYSKTKITGIALVNLLAIVIMPSMFNAQCDYTSPRYAISAELGVFYGSSTSFDGTTDSLFLDIYKPVGDFNDQRPLAIWCFGGGFIGGQREDFASLCQDMARRGYVAVTIDYRLGYVKPDILPLPFAADDKELLRAAYRAMQDAKGAIRFMKNRHLSDSIDLDEVYIGGGSAGAITALAAAFLRNTEDIDSTIVGELPPTKTSVPIERPALGSVDGTLNLGEEDADVQGVVNIFGALFDVAQIRTDDALAIYSYHQIGDPVVPCDRNKAYWGFPFVPDNMPFGSGSCEINDYLIDIDYDQNLYSTWVYDGNEHAIHNEEAVFGEALIFLDRQICGQTTYVRQVEGKSLNVFPNPAFDFVEFEHSLDTELSVFNVFGQEVDRIGPRQKRYSISHLTGGTYVLRSRDGKISAKFVKAQ